MASNEIEEGSATERVVQEETDYNSAFRCPNINIKSTNEDWEGKLEIPFQNP